MVLKQSSATFSCPSLFDVLRNNGLSLSNCFPALSQFKSMIISRLWDWSEINNAMDCGARRVAWQFHRGSFHHRGFQGDFQQSGRISRLWILVTNVSQLHRIRLRPSAANIIFQLCNGLSGEVTCQQDFDRE